MEKQKYNEKDIKLNEVLSNKELKYIKQETKKSLDNFKKEIEADNKKKLLIESELGRYIESLKTGTKGIKRAQEYFDIPVTGKYSKELFYKICVFQEKFGLGVDGIPGRGFNKKLDYAIENKLKEKEKEFQRKTIEKNEYIKKSTKIFKNDFSDIPENNYLYKKITLKLEKNLNKYNGFEKEEIDNIYINHKNLFHKEIKTARNWIKVSLNKSLENEFKDIETTIKSDKINEKYRDEAQSLYIHIKERLKEIAITFENSYPKNRFYSKLKEISNLVGIDNFFRYDSETKLIVDILKKYKSMELENINTYISLLKEVSYLEENKNKQEETEKIWSIKQKEKYKTRVNRNFENTINTNTYGFLNYLSKNELEEIRNGLKDIIKDILDENNPNILEKLREYSKKYNIYIEISANKNLNFLINDLAYKVGNVKKIQILKQKNNKLEKDIFHNKEINPKEFSELRLAINKTINRASRYLNNSEIKKLESKLINIYKNGITSKNPKQYWDNYNVINLYNSKRPYFEEIPAKSIYSSFDKALTSERIKAMQKKLRKMSYNEFKDIAEQVKKDYGIKGSIEYKSNREKFIKGLQSIFGITSEVGNHLIDVEKRYGKDINEAIDEINNKFQNRKINFIDIFGTKETAKDNVLKLIITESLGYSYSHTLGIKSTAIGILQKVYANFTRFKINPFNAKDSIKSYFENIVIAFNSHIPEKAFNSYSYEEKKYIASLIHFSGEGRVEDFINIYGIKFYKLTKSEIYEIKEREIKEITNKYSSNNKLKDKNIKKVTKSLFNAKDFYKKVRYDSTRVKNFNNMGLLKFSKKDIDIKNIIDKLNIERKKFSIIAQANINKNKES